jgi:membrane-associated phospholipid phosphatase
MHVQPQRTRPGALLRACCFAMVLVTLPVAAQSPFELSWGRDGAIVGAGIAFHGISLLQTRSPMPQWTAPLDPSGLPRIDRVAVGRWEPKAHRASNVLFGAALGASLATAMLVQNGHDLLVPVVIILESGLLASGITNMAKEAVKRPRPYLYDPAVPVGLHKGRDDRHSFWSGHTATTAAFTFAAAGLVQHSSATQGVRTATWAGAISVPMAMGWLRVRAGRHFPTDVLTGYVVGALVGLAVPYFHRLNTGEPGPP